MKSRFTEEQIIRQAEAGVPIKELCRTGGFSDATFYKWRAKLGGMDASDAQWLRELEAENAKLKRPLAEAHLDMDTSAANPPTLMGELHDSLAQGLGGGIKGWRVAITVTGQPHNTARTAFRQLVFVNHPPDRLALDLWR